MTVGFSAFLNKQITFVLDDFDGKFCNQGKYPLINSVKANFLDGIQPQIQSTTKSSSTGKPNR